jgi:hypothetical protein
MGTGVFTQPRPEGAALGKEEVALYEVHRGKRGPVPKEEAYRAAAIWDKAASAAFIHDRGIYVSKAPVQARRKAAATTRERTACHLPLDA